MKIQKIFIRNLNSLAGDHHIDFNKKPLANSTLFAITGPTGSGKSTILDAICLALYNASPRLDQSITSGLLLKSGALISKGATEAFVSVEYTQGSDRYKSQWSIAYNRNNNLNERKQELSTFDVDKNETTYCFGKRNVSWNGPTVDNLVRFQLNTDQLKQIFHAPDNQVETERDILEADEGEPWLAIGVERT
jgi:DNA repair exonuclease SbcCD ATPase subunit